MDAQNPEGAGWREYLVRYIERECRPVEKFGHQPRLYALTRLIGAELVYDDDVVYAAAWVHDIGVFHGHRPADLQELARWDNVGYAMDLAPAILEEAGFPSGKLSAVLEAIRTHQASADPRGLESVILRDADILEQLGSIGILRAVCKIGRDTRFPTFTSVIDMLRKAGHDLPNRLRLNESRQIAKPRVEFLRNFLSAVDHDSFQALY